MIHIDNKLQYLRELHDFKQQDIAKMLGVSRSTYANYESGRRTPDIDLLMNLADIYGITLDELTGHEVNETNVMQLSQQALRMLKSFNQLPLPIQEWYIAHMELDAKPSPLLPGTPLPAIDFEKGQEK